MADLGLTLTELLFTAIVFVAILGVFSDHAEYVIAGLIFAVIWQLVSVFGPNLFLATFLVFVFVALRAIAMVTDLDGWTPTLVPFLDDWLTRRETGGRDPEERRVRSTSHDRPVPDGSGVDDRRR